MGREGSSVFAKIPILEGNQYSLDSELTWSEVLLSEMIFNWRESSWKWGGWYFEEEGIVSKKPRETEERGKWFRERRVEYEAGQGDRTEEGLCNQDQDLHCGSASCVFWLISSLTSLRRCCTIFPARELEIELWVVVKIRVNVYEVQCLVLSRCQVTGGFCPGGETKDSFQEIKGRLRSRWGDWKR